ncbi:MerR family transcriptional regulator [Streptomyces sp. NPDC091212]|uniref:helix-turn-helix domain-containing protein n=1 Tax=Streptomyces sp. NPDC091212 TaxID=3155191 RepID=UPI003449C4DD
MGWSTRQLAELAGTTLRTVRHYHEIGLMAEPERRANGYKDYGVPHLVRVLRIKRLTALGLSLTRIAELGDADEHPEEALRKLDGELAASIERQQQLRTELDLILRHSAPTELPAELGGAVAAANVSAADRALTVVMSQVLGKSALDTYAATLRNYEVDPALAEFDALPAEADKATRQDLAERMLQAPAVRKMLAEFPSFEDLSADAPHGADFARRAIVLAVVDLYNPAQLDVLVRMNC